MAKTKMNLIASIAMSATNYLELFNKNRKDCQYHAFNILTEDHNCFNGNTKTECTALLCPLKGKE